LELNAQAETLVSEVKTGTGKVEAIQSQMKEIQAKRDEEASKISGETSQLEGQANELVAQRAQFLPQIEKRILMNYDRVRGARAGIGISPALGGRCGVCNMAVPPQMYIELQKGRDLHSCPSCHRILYVK
jgi:predicted  nucleic acid-binding Zn-ribbon protein